MLYSQAELRRAQDRDFRRLAPVIPGAMSEIAASHGDPGVLVYAVVMGSEGPVYTPKRALVFPEPGFPPDLPPQERRGFPANLMEVRLAKVDPRLRYVLRTTYPYHWGSVDIDRLRPRRRGRVDSNALDQAAAHANDTPQLTAYLRSLDKDLWSSESDPDSVVARPSLSIDPGESLAPGIALDAVAALDEIVKILPRPRGEAWSQPHSCVTLCGDLEEYLTYLHEHRQLRDEAEDARKVLGDLAPKLHLACCLLSLSGPTARSEVKEGLLGGSLDKRVSQLMKRLGLSLALERGLPSDELLSLFTASADCWEDELEEAVQLLGTGQLDVNVAGAKKASQSADKRERLNAVAHLGACLILVPDSRREALDQLKSLAAESPCQEARSFAELLVTLYGNF